MLLLLFHVLDGKIKTSVAADLNRNLKGVLVDWINLLECLELVNLFLAQASQLIHIIMQHPTLTLIVRYPNNTLHLATQEHLKNKIIVKC